MQEMPKEKTMNVFVNGVARMLIKLLTLKGDY